MLLHQQNTVGDRHKEDNNAHQVSYVYPGSPKGSMFTSPTAILEMIAKYMAKETNLKICNTTL